jgi:hypothetical protein
MSRKQMLSHLKSLGINEAVADKAASTEGNPAILLRWNGREEYYTGFGADIQAEPQPEYEAWLVQTFGDKNAE